MSFVACSGKKEKRYKIGVSQCSAESWRWKTNDEIEREKMFHDNVDVEIRSADDKNEKQIEDIRYFMDNGFDLIIANPNQGDALTPIIKEAHDRGIPVITFDRKISDDSYTVHMEVDNEEIGKSVAAYALHLVKHRPMKIIEIQGDSTMTPTKKRHSGFVSGLNGNQDVEIVSSVYANWNPEITERKVDSLLDIYPDVDLIYAHSDVMAISASRTTKRKGLTGIKFLGIDGNPQVGIKAVADGEIDATFLYPTYGYKLLRTAIDILDGKKVARDITVPPLSPVDKSNADIMIQQDSLMKEETGKILVLKDQIDDYWQQYSSQKTLLYAAVVIMVLLFGVIFLLWRSYWQHRRHQQLLTEQYRLLQEERDKQKDLYIQLEEATQSKLAFFTNVSHDLRTPLTLIAEPVNQLLENKSLPEEKRRSLLKIASKNVRILGRLIEQILDFRKYENGKLKANLSEVRIYQLISEWIESFNAVIAKRDLKLTVDIPDDPEFRMAVDVEKMERVFFNIMSNAIKYTPNNGKIKVECRCDGNELRIAVSDTGEGIAPEDLKRVFDRFYRVDKVRPKGSGIGLSLAKAFAELHGGTITAESEKGKGSKFTVILPVTHVEEEEEKALPEKQYSQSEIDEELGDVETDLPEINEDETEKTLLLVVDDNKDIQTLVEQLLSDEYRVICASNGRQGLKMASRYIPDIIVCDVMMPVMDGLECCRRLKNEVSTSHIPVLMLTACSMDEQRLEGYESGADSYIPKPFKSEILKARCRNLIDNRRRIKEIYSSSSATTGSNGAGAEEKKGGDTPGKHTPDAIPLNIDNEFYNKFLGIVNERLSDPDLSIDEIAGKMNLSRSQLSRKIKSLTNYTPVEIVRNMRLRQARRLLTSTDRTISEIAYAVGFSLPAYFSKCYKDAFGESPSDLRSRMGF